MKRIIFCLTLIGCFLLTPVVVDAIPKGKRSRYVKKTVKPKQLNVTAFFLPRIDKTKTNTINSALKGLLEVLILYSLVIQVIKLVDSVFANQYDDIPVQHQVLTFVTYLIGLVAIPNLMHSFFHLPDILPFSYF